MFRAVVAITVSVLAFAPLAVWLTEHVHVSPAELERLSRPYVYATDCKPEPGERLAFLAGLVLLPASLLALVRAKPHWAYRPGWPRAPVVGFVAELALAAALLVGCWYAIIEEDYVHVRKNLLFDHPWASAPLGGGALLVLWRGPARSRLARWALHGVVLAAVALVFGCSLLTEDSVYVLFDHFSAVFSGVLQVHQGKTLLVDGACQYGLYPHILSPVFAVCGLSVRTFAAVMGLLTVTSYLLLWRALCRTTRHRLVALVGFLALVCVVSFFLRLPADQFMQEPYFQYTPIRLLVPAGLVWLAVTYLRRPTRGRTWVITLVLAGGTLWNLDAGLPAYLTWHLTLAYRDLLCGGWASCLRRSVGHAARGLAVLAGVVALHTGFVWLRCGALPDYARLLYYQKAFYGSGFYMLPLPFPGTWLLVVATYLAGLAYAASALGAGATARRAPVIFLLAVLGAGLFPYYQGRSHVHVLPFVCWPCFLLWTLFLDELLDRLRHGSGRPLACFFTVLLVAALGGFAGTLVVHGPGIRGKVRDQIRPPRPATFLHEDAALLRERTQPGDRWLLLSHGDCLLYLLSGVPSPSPTCLAEQVATADIRRLVDLVGQDSVKVFLGRVLGARRRAYPCFRELFDAILAHYEVAGRGRQGFVLEQGPRLLPGPGRPAFQCGFRGGVVPAAFRLWPVQWCDPGTLEVVFRPGPIQLPAATVLGNDPGPAGREGFVIRHAGGETYELVCGDGRRQQTSLTFCAAAVRWHHVAIVREGEVVRAYVDGCQASSGTLPVGGPAPSSLPLSVGSGSKNDRPFRGLIKEVRVLDEALSEDAIRTRAHLVREALP